MTRESGRYRLPWAKSSACLSRRFGCERGKLAPALSIKSTSKACCPAPRQRPPESTTWPKYMATSMTEAADPASDAQWARRALLTQPPCSRACSVIRAWRSPRTCTGTWSRARNGRRRADVRAVPAEHWLPGWVWLPAWLPAQRRTCKPRRGWRDRTVGVGASCQARGLVATCLHRWWASFGKTVRRPAAAYCVRLGAMPEFEKFHPAKEFL